MNCFYFVNLDLTTEGSLTTQTTTSCSMDIFNMYINTRPNERQLTLRAIGTSQQWACQSNNKHDGISTGVYRRL
jgi:hypothetical protein